MKKGTKATRLRQLKFGKKFISYISKLLTRDDRRLKASLYKLK